jgi:hypothetical protein
MTTPHLRTMASIKTEAIDCLSHHRLTPELILMKLEENPVIILKCGNHSEWTFVSRHRCRRYLMAKSSDMKRFEEIYFTSH